MLVLIDAPLPDADAERIRRLSPDITLKIQPPSDEPLPADALREAEVIYTENARFDPALAPRLRWVMTNSAATQPVRDKPILRTSIPIVNVSGAYSVAVAELALGMLLALTRRITQGVRYQLRSEWPPEYPPWQGQDLYGMTLGIVGYGSIGRQVGRLAQALGLTVLAYKRRPELRRDDSYLIPGTGDPEGLIPAAWYGPHNLGEMFRQLDVALIVLPSTPLTDGLIGAALLQKLRPHAYLVNVGRGAVIDEAALIQALETKALAGAALDVFVNEPLPRDSPFWTLPNVLVMPHIASYTKLQTRRAADVLFQNLQRDLRGEPLLNIIDKELLY